MTSWRRSARMCAVVASAVLGLAACEEEKTAAKQEPAEKTVSTPAAPVTVDPSKKAALTMAIVPLGYLIKDGRHRYTQNRAFTESAGVGVTLTFGKVCVDRGNECVSAEVSYRVEPNTTALRKGQYVATKTIPDIATIEYSGIDDNGNAVRVFAEIELDVPKQPGE